MKTLILLCLLIGSAFAQDYSGVLYYRGRSLGNTPAAQIAKAREIITLVQGFASEQGTVTQLTNLTDKTGNTYPVLVINPVKGSALNTEAERVLRVFGGLPLVFSPYDLGRSGADAFFDPTGKMLGVSYDFILGDYNSSSYLHELYHASNYQKVLAGKNPEWAGVMRALKGHYVSSKNTESYTRFVSLDELPATALSLHLDTQNLLQMRRTQTPVDFNRSRGDADNLLGEIYFSAKTGKLLARQVQDVLGRAIVSTATPTNAPLTLGTTTRHIPTLTFLLDSYSFNTTGSRTLITEAQGTEFKLYSSTTLTSQFLQIRLQNLIAKARNAEAAFDRAEKCIYIMIEYPRLEKTDFSCLEREAGRPFAFLDKI